MTRDELIAMLQAIPENHEVLVERGEWGPCVLAVGPRVTTCDMSNGTHELWEVAYPECEPINGEIRKTVILL
jgi:hypothetical protein